MKKPSKVLRAIIEDGGDYKAFLRAPNVCLRFGDRDAYSFIDEVIPTGVWGAVFSWCRDHSDLIPEMLHRALSLALEVERRS